MSRTNLLWLLGVPALFAIGVSVTATAPPPDKDYQLVRRIVDVLAEVDKHYVRELSDSEKKKFVEDMINGGLEKLDPHSMYLNEEYFRDFESDTRGQFGGIGVILGIDPKTLLLRVESPNPGTPAFEAGLQAGDLITRIEGVSTEGLTIPEARKKITGPIETSVTLTVFFLDEGKERDVTLTRRLMEQRTISGMNRDPADPAKWNWFADADARIALIRLATGFNEKTMDELTAAMKEIDAAGAKGLILDMRNNPGGLLSQAIAVCDLFLPEADVVSTRDRRQRTKPRRAKTDGVPWESASERPMVVLIDRGSASASEIVAAAMQDHRRAVVIGERSFGKGSVQKIYEFDDKQTAVKLTAEEWLRPSGQSIHRFPTAKATDSWGVVPDAGFEVKMTAEDYREYVKSVNDATTIRRKGNEGNSKSTAKDKILSVAVESLKKTIAR